MQVSDEECAAFVRLCRETEGVELSIDEARAMISNLLLVLERFAEWEQTRRRAEEGT